MQDEVNIQSIVDLTRETAQPQTAEQIHYIVIPEGSKVVSLKEQQYPEGLPPSRRKANAKFFDAVSFTRYVGLFADDRTRTFAKPEIAEFLSVLDYHGAGAGDVRKPEFCEHRASYKMVESEQWKIWLAGNMKAFSQVDFAEFIEDQTRDLLNPDAATMVEIASELKSNTEVSFDSKVKRSNGNVQMRYQETTTATVGQAGIMEVPETFTIAIPVFYGEEKVVISARLRFRITGGKLTFNYKLDSPVEIMNEAFKKAVASIGESLKTDVLLGTP